MAIRSGLTHQTVLPALTATHHQPPINKTGTCQVHSPDHESMTRLTALAKI